MRNRVWEIRTDTESVFVETNAFSLEIEMSVENKGRTYLVDKSVVEIFWEFVGYCGQR